MHDNILILAKSKLNSIMILISKALNDMDISHEEFTIILDEKDKYDKMKYKIINENEIILSLIHVYIYVCIYV